jgi:hypothetical protein
MRIIYKTRITRAQRVALLNSGRATISATTSKLTRDKRWNNGRARATRPVAQWFSFPEPFTLINEALARFVKNEMQWIALNIYLAHCVLVYRKQIASDTRA